MMEHVLIRLDEVSKYYGEGAGRVEALHEINFALLPGERVLVVGPSGSGKTTFLSIIGCLLKASSGSCYIEREKVNDKAEKELARIRAVFFGFVFQEPHLFPALNAFENVAMTLQMKNGEARDYQFQADYLLERVHVLHRKLARPHELSGGEKQRVAIARALAGNPTVILADEPTASLDSKTAMEVMSLLEEVSSQEGHALMVVTHDTRLEKFMTRVVSIQDGEIVL